MKDHFVIKRLTVAFLYLLALGLAGGGIQLTLKLIPSPPPDDDYLMAENDIQTIQTKNFNKYGIDHDWQRPDPKPFSRSIIADTSTTSIEAKTEHSPFRILIVGDSLVHGDRYANQNYVWPEAFRNQMLADAYQVEIYRVGVGGYSTYDLYLLLSQTDVLDIIQPDLIIMGIFINDLEPVSYVETNAWPESFLSNDIFAHTGANTWTTFIKTYFPGPYTKINTAIIQKFGKQVSWLDNYGYEWYRYHYEYLMRQENLDFFKNHTLLPLKNFLESRQLPLAFVACHHDPSLETQIKFYQPVGKLLSEAGIPYYNLLTDLIEENTDYGAGYDWQKTEFTVSPVDNHPGPRSTQLCARKLQTALERDFPQLLQKNPTPPPENQIIINDYLPYELDLTQVGSYSYKFQYPNYNQEAAFLYWPVGTAYIKLNFQFPVDLDKIIISGRFSAAKLWITKLNHEKSYLDSDGKLAIWDDQLFYKLEESASTEKYLRQETELTFEIDEDDLDITTLNLNLNTHSGNVTPINIEFVPR